MSQYKTGAVSVTNGSQVVTGTGTLWLSNVSPGDGFTVAGTGVPYTVGSVDSDTQITLNANYAGPSGSGLAYAIWRDFTAQNNLPEMSQGDIETATTFTRAMRLIDGSLADIQGDYYKSDNILGTASQSGGIPTGAIIERGSNANGEYTKFADGTLECSAILQIDYDTANRMRVDWTYPAAFADIPRWTANLVGYGANGTVNFSFTNRTFVNTIGELTVSCPSGTASGNSLSLTVYRPSGSADFASGDKANVSVIVKGRWF
ncbi:hypothetical protein [Marinobacter algicola]|uniref:Prophage PSPPH04, tail fiber domain protein n=1 Tax=Marinobacter algicola DG893 TaxID=443152 RepID=A6F0I6_9GAMM|nr:hypothetical protein [Marinobacter algicola]EDM47747.1 prophage PSPPH04, tail fiber domain protein [Marinobacter algicola DG893]